MHAARRPGRRVVSTFLAATALLALSACGAPSQVRALEGEPDLVSIKGRIPQGFSGSVHEELQRLSDACTALDPSVGTHLPAAHLSVTDGQCQWSDTAAPALVVGILANPNGSGALDQTLSVLKNQANVNGVGDRADFDLETRTLYVVKNGRLWYLQLVGSAPGAASRTILSTLGRDLVATHAAIR